MAELRTHLLLLLVLVLPADARSAAPLRRVDPDDLAACIDRRLAAHFESTAIRPAPSASDSEFLRRAYFDLTGRIPRPADVHEFLADNSSDKRARLIDQLLEEPRFAVHFANVWRADFMPGADPKSAGEPPLRRMRGEVARSRRRVDVLPFWQQVRGGCPSSRGSGAADPGAVATAAASLGRAVGPGPCMLCHVGARDSSALRSTRRPARRQPPRWRGQAICPPRCR
jgi:hypothetical protein